MTEFCETHGNAYNIAECGQCDRILAIIRHAKNILWELSYSEKEPCRSIRVLREVAWKQAQEEYVPKGWKSIWE